MDLLRKRKS